MDDPTTAGRLTAGPEVKGGGGGGILCACVGGGGGGGGRSEESYHVHVPLVL